MIQDFRLKVFCTLFEKNSYTKTAETLFISQPAVTRHIKELEEKLQCRLFDRKGNTIIPTPSGVLVYQYALEILNKYDALENAVQHLDKKISGSLKLGASTTVSQYVLPSIIARFKQNYPELSIEISTGNTELIEQKLLEEKIDFALVEGKSNHNNLHYENFIKDELVLVVRNRSKLGLKSEINHEKLKLIPLALREQGSGTLEVLRDHLKKQKISIKDLSVEIRLDSTESIKQYIQHRDCAAFLSIHSIQNELKQGLLEIIEIKGLEMSRYFRFVSLSGKSKKQSDLFRKFCLKSL